MALETLNTEAETDTAAAPEVRMAAPATKSQWSLGKPSGTVGVDTSILQRMQELLDEKQSQKESFAENIYNAMAMAAPQEYRTQALEQRERVKNKREKDIFEIQSEIARYKVAQEQARRTGQSLDEVLKGGVGTGTEGGIATGGLQMPSHVASEVARLRRTQGDTAAEAYYQKWLNTETTERIKKQQHIDYNLPKIPVIKTDPATGERYVEEISAAEFDRDEHLYRNDSRAIAARQRIQTPSAPAAAAPAAPAAAPAAAKPAAAATAPVSVRNNNPGNLVDPKTGQIKKFDTPEQGQAALEQDIAAKLGGNSAAYKARFADAPVSPITLAETWAPSNAPGNSMQSTANYANHIANALGIGSGETIPNTPEARSKVARAIAEFESGQRATAPIQLAAAPVTTRTDATAAEPPPAAAAPAKVAARQPTARELLDVQKARAAGLEEEMKGKGKAAAMSEDSFVDSGRSAVPRTASLDNIGTLIDNAKKSVGVLAKPGLIPAFLSLAQEGISLGNFGTVGLKNISDFVRKNGGQQKDIDAAIQISQEFAKLQLANSRSYLKGQGAVSDAERKLLADLSGNVEMSEGAIKRFLGWNRMLADYDRKLYNYYESEWLPKNPNVSFRDFMLKDQTAISMRKEYEQKLLDYAKNVPGGSSGTTSGGVKFKIITPTPQKGTQ